MTTNPPARPARAVPTAVYVLGAGVFAMVTSEFAVAGLMPQLAEGLGVGIQQIGYLVTVFAVAMAVGGPVLTLALLRLRPKTALMAVFAVFFAGNLLAALAPSYSAMVAARVVSGVASQAFFGIAISLCSQLVHERVRGRAVGVVMNGLMLGTLLGLPMATYIGGRLGWQAAFWAIAVLTALAAALTAAIVRNPAGPVPDGPGGASLAAQITVFRRPHLLLALVSSTLIIGATFSVFSFFTPILTEVSGFDDGTVPFLLLAYGAATVVGNTVVGRLADRHTGPTLLAGTLLNAACLTGFALFTDVPPLALAFVLGVGLVGVTMNPAMAVRVQRAGGTQPLVNTVHSSFITLGVILGSAIGSLLIPDYGLRSPIVLGIVMAVSAIAVILPALRRPRPSGGLQTDAALDVRDARLEQVG
ncbi:MFS transporter [Glycomyces sp. A-F 0318]|uniref:MFS transporter n=1 Tax=Glycomyces amatae TaxID=2881355 RepID=UPI001E63F478|nr:MFS transporter [Glycomyces amatae]MCD0445648.1 MFS transporter [Glycomyces amatae]